MAIHLWPPEAVGGVPEPPMPLASNSGTSAPTSASAASQAATTNSRRHATSTPAAAAAVQALKQATEAAVPAATAEGPLQAMQRAQQGPPAAAKHQDLPPYSSCLQDLQLAGHPGSSMRDGNCSRGSSGCRASGGGGPGNDLQALLSIQVAGAGGPAGGIASSFSGGLPPNANPAAAMAAAQAWAASRGEFPGPCQAGGALTVPGSLPECSQQAAPGEMYRDAGRLPGGLRCRDWEMQPSVAPYSWAEAHVAVQHGYSGHGDGGHVRQQQQRQGAGRGIEEDANTGAAQQQSLPAARGAAGAQGSDNMTAAAAAMLLAVAVSAGSGDEGMRRAVLQKVKAAFEGGVDNGGVNADIEMGVEPVEQKGMAQDQQQHQKQSQLQELQQQQAALQQLLEQQQQQQWEYDLKKGKRAAVKLQGQNQQQQQQMKRRRVARGAQADTKAAARQLLPAAGGEGWGLKEDPGSRLHQLADRAMEMLCASAAEAEAAEGGQASKQPSMVQGAANDIAPPKKRRSAGYAAAAGAGGGAAGATGAPVSLASCASSAAAFAKEAPEAAAVAARPLDTEGAGKASECPAAALITAVAVQHPVTAAAAVVPLETVASAGGVTVAAAPPAAAPSGFGGAGDTLEAAQPVQHQLQETQDVQEAALGVLELCNKIEVGVVLRRHAETQGGFADLESKMQRPDTQDVDEAA